MNAIDFLRSRRWRQTPRGGYWFKRGWTFRDVTVAARLEEWMESHNGAVTPRDEITPEELREVAKHLGFRRIPSWASLERLDWAGIMALAAAKLPPIEEEK